MTLVRSSSSFMARALRSRWVRICGRVTGELLVQGCDARRVPDLGVQKARQLSRVGFRPCVHQPGDADRRLIVLALEPADPVWSLRTGGPQDVEKEGRQTGIVYLAKRRI